MHLSNRQFLATALAAGILDNQKRRHVTPLEYEFGFTFFIPDLN
jgi:hypothetical protein